MPSGHSQEENLALTARWTAAARARESERTDRLFDDPWADLLAGQEGKAWIERSSADQGDAFGTFQAIRTRFFDDFLLHVTMAHQIRQVVIVAAGMDTRRFRRD